MKNQKGFTLVELMVVMVILGLFSTLLLGRGGCAFFGSQEENIMKTKAMMMKYVQFKVPEATTENTEIQVQTVDTDGNGYVRCEAVVRLENGIKEVQAECPFAFSLGNWLGNECTFAKVPITY